MKSHCRKHIQNIHFPPTSACDNPEDQILNLGWNEIEFEKSGKVWCCPYDGCGYKHRQRFAIEEHYRTHTGEKPFQCKLCGKQYNQKEYCKKHAGKCIIKNTAAKHSRKRKHE